MTSLTAYNDMLPVPRVEIVVTTPSLIATTATITLRAKADGRTFEVRDGIRVPAATTVVRFDYEPAFNVPSVYEALCYNAAGVYLGAVRLGTVTVACDLTVLQQPLDPRRNAIVGVLAESARAIERPASGELVWPDGAEFPVMVGQGPRRGIVGMTYSVYTDTLAMANRLQATLGGYDDRQLQMWLIRSPNRIRLPRKLFCGVANFVEADVNLRIGKEGIRFTASLTEMAPPAPGRSPSVLRYSDVGAVFSTYSALGATYTLYSDIARDQSLVGAAG